MSRFAVLPLALLMLLTVAAPVAAAEPVHSTTTGTYSLADAIFDYENFGIYDGDCGDFVLLVDFDVIRSVTTWPDREIRHVQLRGPLLQRLRHVEIDRPEWQVHADLPVRRDGRPSST